MDFPWSDGIFGEDRTALKKKAEADNLLRLTKKNDDYITVDSNKHRRIGSPYHDNVIMVHGNTPVRASTVDFGPNPFNIVLVTPPAAAAGMVDNGESSSDSTMDYAPPDIDRIVEIPSIAHNLGTMKGRRARSRKTTKSKPRRATKSKSTTLSKEKRLALAQHFNPFTGDGAVHFDDGCPGSLTKEQRWIETINIIQGTSCVVAVLPDCVTPFVYLNGTTFKSLVTPNICNWTAPAGSFFTTDGANGLGILTNGGTVEKWRYVSGGVRFRNLNATTENTGFFEAVRINEHFTDSKSVLFNSAGTCHMSPSTFYMDEIINDEDVPLHVSYCNGELKNIQSHVFPCRAIDNHHPFKMIPNSVSLTGGSNTTPGYWLMKPDAVMDWTEFQKVTMDYTYSPVLIKLTAGSKDQSIVIDCKVNYEVIHTVTSSLAKYHKIRKGDKKLDKTVQDLNENQQSASFAYLSTT